MQNEKTELPLRNVLIVDDDPGYGEFLAKMMRKIGARPLWAKSILEACHLLAENQTHLILLDRVLGKGDDGLRFCLNIKRNPQKRLIPIIILTGKMNDFKENVKGYRYGADLYLPKSTSLGKLIKYVEVFLHRLPYNESDLHRIVFKNITLDLRNRTVQVGSILSSDFPEKQFHLLSILVSHQGETVSRRHLIGKLWHEPVRDKELDVLVSRLRHSLGYIGGAAIVSVRGYGYRVLDPADAASFTGSNPVAPPD